MNPLRAEKKRMKERNEKGIDLWTEESQKRETKEETKRKRTDEKKG